MERRIEDGVVKAKEALAELVSRGLAVRHKGRDAGTPVELIRTNMK
jgi:hypothetical protein